MANIAIVGGGGTVGSSAAFRLATLDIVSDIVLIDARENMAKSHAMDLGQAVCAVSSTSVHAGSWHDLRGSSVVILAASMPERKVSSRDEYLWGNVEIIRDVAPHLSTNCPEALVVVATNPVDVFTAVLPRLANMESHKFLGYSWNDTLRLRWAVAGVLGVPVSDVDGLVIGEHGEMQVPLFDRVTVDSKPANLTSAQKAEAEAAIRMWFSAYQQLGSGRTSGWTSAIGISELVESIVSGHDEPLPGSAVLEGQYGLSGVSLGVPVRVGLRGVEEIVELPITDTQLAALRSAARKVREQLDLVVNSLMGQEGVHE